MGMTVLPYPIFLGINGLSASANGGGDAFPVGTILPYIGDVKDIPKKWRLCDGTNGTPDLTGRFLEGVTANAKKFKEAALPNIYGDFSANAFGSGELYSNVIIGAIRTRHSTTGHWVVSSNYSYYHTFDIDASRCSPVYRNDCSTVQPASYTVMYIIKVQK